MPRRKEHGKKCPPESGVDLIDALPDEVIHHVLSFLPAQEAVRTCMLARRWRHLWKSTTGLRIMGATQERSSVQELREFVDHLLLLRGSSPLDTCDIFLAGYDDHDVPRVNLWIRHVIVVCKVRVLRMDIYRYGGGRFQLDGPPLVSRHLTSVQLFGLSLSDSFLNFSSCPALEHLEIEDCFFAGCKRIFSWSLKCLSITDCFLTDNYRIRICAQDLVSLQLDITYGRTPVLEAMPSLVEAVVKIDPMDEDGDACSGADSGGCDDEDCDACYGMLEDDNDKCVLLQGLSEAENLELIADTEMFIFRRDLKWCPSFRKLKTLVLDEYWCVPVDLSALACILEHAPVLERLTLQLFSTGTNHKVNIKGSRHPLETSTVILERIKIVEIKCQVVDETVLKVLTFLSTLNICFSFKEEKA